MLGETPFRQRLLASGNLPGEGTRQAFTRRIAEEAAALHRLPGSEAPARR